MPLVDIHLSVRNIRYLFKRNELTSTETELNAIAPEAIIGFNLPDTATGIAP